MSVVVSTLNQLAFLFGFIAIGYFLMKIGICSIRTSGQNHVE